MKIQGKGKAADRAKESVEKIVESFKSGNIPEALAQVYLNVNKNQPSAKWSIRNQLIQIIMGATDGRGYGQWQEVGRQVRKGAEAFAILAPVTVKAKDKAGNEVRDTNGKPAYRLIGFRGVNVFDISQTDVTDDAKWAKNKATDDETDNYIANLPLRDVAESWGLQISAVAANGALGWYMPGRAIAVGVENLATWAHELVHAADDKKGNLIERGQHWRSECVAELGGATLLLALGYETDADLGGAFEYIEKYAKEAKLETVEACMKVLTRVTAAVSLILDEANKIAENELIPA